jgi:hypothetical protein
MMSNLLHGSKLDKISNDDIFKISLTYTTRLELFNSNNSIYKLAKKRNIFDKASKHMKKHNSVVWNLPLAKKAVLNYTSSSELKNKNKPLWIWIHKHKHNKELFIHFIKPKSTRVSRKPSSNKPCTLYYLKIIKNNKYYYKIGITTQPYHRRYRSSERKNMNILFYINFASGIDTWNIESMFLTKYKKYRLTTNDDILISGNSEIFTKDVLFG